MAGGFTVQGPYLTWEEAVNVASELTQLYPEVDFYPTKLCKRNKYGVPVYPFPLDDSGDD